jgi:excisionase family DNA binding protein
MRGYTQPARSELVGGFGPAEGAGKKKNAEGRNRGSCEARCAKQGKMKQNREKLREGGTTRGKGALNNSAVPEWFDLEGLSKYAPVCRRTLLDWIRDGLPASKVGGKWYIRRRDFDTYLERHRA